MASSNKKKTIAFGKSAKIDSAQKNMFIAICLASVAVGITIVLSIYFAKTIKYNSRLIEEKDKTIVGFKANQENITSLKSTVEDLVKNENLEAVARTRAKDCKDNSAKEISNDDFTLDSIEVAKTCSALRVMPDSLPAELNGEAAMSSIMKIVLASNGGTGVNAERVVLENGDAEEMSSDLSDKIHNISVSIDIKDSLSRISGALSTLENSIRNFDINEATISFNDTGEVEFESKYNTYFSDSVNFDVKERVVCANATNKKCPGDTVGDAYGAIEENTSSEEESE